MARSPFTGASRSDLRLYRVCARLVAEWERAARAGQFRPMDHWAAIPGGLGGIKPQFVLMAFLNRAWGRIGQLPQGREYLEIDRLDRLRRFDPCAYEPAMLRKELAEHREECRGGHN